MSFFPINIDSQLADDEFPEPLDASFDMEELRSALVTLDPDCDEKTYQYHRVAPLANAATDHPQLAQALQRLACDWSSGKLRGVPAKTWTDASQERGPRRARFTRIWLKFFESDFQGRRATVSTILWAAREQGRMQSQASGSVTE